MRNLRGPSAESDPASQVWHIGQMLIIEGNVIEMPADTTAELGLHLHDNGLTGQEPDHVLGDVIIRGNKIRYLDGLAEEDSTGSGIEVNGAKNLLVRENLVEVLSANPICHQRCRSANYFNNRTADGVLLPKYDDSTGRWVEELDAQAEDALVQSLFRR